MITGLFNSHKNIFHQVLIRSLTHHCPTQASVPLEKKQMIFSSHFLSLIFDFHFLLLIRLTGYLSAYSVIPAGSFVIRKETNREMTGAMNLNIQNCPMAKVSIFPRKHKPVFSLCLERGDKRACGESTY